jgi:hypothetical protein
MDSTNRKTDGTRGSLKTALLCAAGGAVAVMAIVTIGLNTSGSDGSSQRVIVADTTTQTTPATTPAVQSAAPTVKATTFAGGDWPGMGAFGEDWA